MRVRGGRILPILVARALLVRVARDSMTRRGWISIGALATLSAYSACAFPEFQFDDEDGDGGAAGMSSMSSSSATSASGGGMIGCTLGEIGACGEGSKCTVVNVDSGDVGCGLAGPRMAWQTCNADSDCVDPTWCDRLYSVCKPFCDSAAACTDDNFNGQCVALRKDAMTEIPGGARHCTADCHPKSSMPCDSSDFVTCIYTGQGFDCARSQNLQQTAACRVSADCKAGLVCVTVSGQSNCEEWCTPSDDFSGDCGGVGYCYPLNPAVTYHGIEYGSCP